MTPKDHHAFLDNLDQALEEAIRRFRALHHVSLAELHEMKAALAKARQAVRDSQADQAPELVQVRAEPSNRPSSQPAKRQINTVAAMER